MYSFAVVLCSVLVAVAAKSTPVSQCVNNGGVLPTNTYIEGCVAPPCTLVRGTTAVINIDFTAPKALSEMRTLATAYLSIGPVSIPVPYDLGSDAVTCNFLTNAACPLEDGQDVQYRLQMYIDEIFPSGTAVTIEFRVADELNEPFVCLRVPVRVQ